MLVRIVGIRGEPMEQSIIRRARELPRVRETHRYTDEAWSKRCILGSRQILLVKQDHRSSPMLQVEDELLGLWHSVDQQYFYLLDNNHITSTWRTYAA